MFELHNATGGGYYWLLKSTNGEKLCHSEVYTSRAAAQNGIDAARRVAPAAPVRDNSR